MLKALLDRVLELAEIKAVSVGNATYTKENIFKRIKSPEQMPPATLTFNTLRGLVDYRGHIITSIEDNVFYSVMGPGKVSLMSCNDPSNDNIQFNYAEAILNVESFHFGVWGDLEMFIISLLSQFKPTTDRDGVIETLAHLSNDHVVQNIDDKFSQKLKVKTGLTTKAEVEIKNPVNLAPYRTFREVEQPSSNFILRYRNRGELIEAALFEGDGGAWKLDAIQNIKNWLTLNTTTAVIG